MVTVDDEVLREFLLESHENLNRMAQDLIDLEGDPDNEELLDSIFRTIHTVKGSCGFINLPKLEALSHAGESLLARLRDKRAFFNQTIASTLLSLLDAIHVILHAVENGDGEGYDNYESLQEKLLQLEPTGQQQPSVSTVDKNLTQKIPKETIGAIPKRDERDVSNTTRVSIEALDTMMNILGELALNQNGIMQSAMLLHDDKLQKQAKQQRLLITQLHDGVLKTRLQAINTMWRGFPRLVRDTGVACGKQVVLQMQGGHTKLDRSILALLKDPLIHLLRNAVDHGIEAAEQRLLAGKPAQGTITLKAACDSGQLYLSVSDDGAGIDVEKVRKRAVQQGLVDAQQAMGLDDDLIFSLIFHPGFSTVEQLTTISGRGVGMDVVKTNIEQAGGFIQVKSKPRLGSSFHISLPLLLAIMQGFVIRCGTQYFSIPSVNIVKLVQLQGACRAVESLLGKPVFRYVNRLIPVVYLGQLLGITDDAIDPHLVIFQIGDDYFGLVVDAIVDTQDIVVKPLSQHFRGLGLYSGCCIDAKGRVTLILNATAIARQVALTGQNILQKNETVEQARMAGEQTRFLLTVAKDQGRMAIPMASVYRVEQIEAGNIEVVNHQQVVQFYGRIIPLLDLTQSGVKNYASSPTIGEQKLPLVICHEQTSWVALIAGEILDVASERVDDKRQTSRIEVAYTTVIQGMVTEVVDVTAIFNKLSLPSFERLRDLGQKG